MMNITKLNFLVTKSIRLDKFLSNQSQDFSRVQIQKAIKEGLVSVNGIQIYKCNFLLSVNNQVNLELRSQLHNNSRNTSYSDTDLPFTIIFEDEDLLVINKNAGLIVHPGAGHHSNTLVDILLSKYKLSNVTGFYPGIVHRLDKDTSGLMIIAKHDIAHHKLAAQIAAKQVQRKYVALVFGVLTPNHGKIIYNIGKSSKNKTKMIVMKHGGKSAITHYQTLKVFGYNALSLVELTLETGRTHQIRVHMSYRKNHIIGDKLYLEGYNYPMKGIAHENKILIRNFPRQALHSISLSFLHPIKNITLNLESSLPNDIKDLIISLDTSS